MVITPQVLSSWGVRGIRVRIQPFRMRFYIYIYIYIYILSIWLEVKEGEKNGRAQVFPPRPPKINIPKSRRKQRRKLCFLVHTSESIFCPLVHSHSKSNAWLFSMFFLFLFLFVLSLNNYQLTRINFNKKKLAKINAFFPL